MALKFDVIISRHFLETNWTFIAYILKIIHSSGEADVSVIEAHREVRSHRINFPALLLPQDDVWKMAAPLNWFRNEFITWGDLSVSLDSDFSWAFFFFFFFRHLVPFVSQSWLPWSVNFGAIFLLFNLATSDVRVSPSFTPCTKNAFNTFGFGWLHKHSH